jgi:hypothetical protein
MLQSYGVYDGTMLAEVRLRYVCMYWYAASLHACLL